MAAAYDPAVRSTGITQWQQRELDSHLAEYAALTNRCTYWIAFQVPIWGALVAFLSLPALLWGALTNDHILLLLGTGFGAQLLVLLWFQTIEEQQLAIEYLLTEVRPRVRELLGTEDIWCYESFSAGRSDQLNWRLEWILPEITSAIGIAFTVYVVTNSRELSPPDVAVLVANGLALAFQWAKTDTRVHRRHRIAAVVVKEKSWPLSTTHSHSEPDRALGLSPDTA